VTALPPPFDLGAWLHANARRRIARSVFPTPRPTGDEEPSGIWVPVLGEKIIIGWHVYADGAQPAVFLGPLSNQNQLPPNPLTKREPA